MRVNRNKQTLGGAIAALGTIFSEDPSSDSDMDAHSPSSRSLTDEAPTATNSRASFYELDSASPDRVDSGDEHSPVIGETVELQPRRRAQPVEVAATLVEPSPESVGEIPAEPPSEVPIEQVVVEVVTEEPNVEEEACRVEPSNGPESSVEATIEQAAEQEASIEAILGQPFPEPSPEQSINAEQPATEPEVTVAPVVFDDATRSAPALDPIVDSSASEPVVLSQSVPVRPDLEPVDFMRHDDPIQPQAVDPVRGKILSLVRLTFALQDVRSSSSETEEHVSAPSEVVSAVSVELESEISDDESWENPISQESIAEDSQPAADSSLFSEVHEPAEDVQEELVEPSIASDPVLDVAAEPLAPEVPIITEAAEVSTEIEPQHVPVEEQAIVPITIVEPTESESSDSSAEAPELRLEREPVVITLIAEDYADLRVSAKESEEPQSELSSEPVVNPMAEPVVTFVEAEELAEEDPLLEHFLSETDATLPCEIDRPPKAQKMELNDLEYSAAGSLLMTADNNVVYDSGAWTSVLSSRLAMESQHLNHGHVGNGHVLLYFKTWKASETQNNAIPASLNDEKVANSRALYHLFGADDPAMDYFSGIKLAQDNLGEDMYPPTTRSVLEWNETQSALILKQDADVDARIQAIRRLTGWLDSKLKIDIFSGAQIGGLQGRKANVIMHALAIINGDSNPRINAALHVFYEHCYQQLFTAIITRKLKPSRIYLSAGPSPDHKSALSAALTVYRRLASYMGKLEVVFIQPAA